MIQSSSSAAPSGAATTAQSTNQQTSKPANGAASASLGQKILRGTTVALAIAIGATGGTFSALGFLQYAQLAQVTEAAPMPTLVDENRAVWSALTQLRADFTDLRAAVDAGAARTNGEFLKAGERIDRIDRAQSELRRSTADLTGSVPAPQRAGAPAQSAVVGWQVRDVYRNAALIQGARFGMIEVSPGDNVPGLGRIQSIRQQDGRWVVVTSRGIIASPR